MHTQLNWWWTDWSPREEEQGTVIQKEVRPSGMESEGPLKAGKSFVDNNNHKARFFKWRPPPPKKIKKKEKEMVLSLSH